MKTSHKQSCPTCGQSVNRRKIPLTKEMVRVMVAIHQWCEENGKHEFSRKEIKHLFLTDVEIATFGNWVYFGGILYWPDEAKHTKGRWGMNMQRAREFIRGEKPINSIAWKDPLTKTIELGEPKFIHQIKGVEEYMSGGVFIPEYEAVGLDRKETIVDIGY